MRIIILLSIITLTQCVSQDNIDKIQSDDPHLIAYYKFNGDLKDEKGVFNGVFAGGNIKSNTKEHFINGYDGKPDSAILFGGAADTWLRVDLGTFSPAKLGIEGEMTVCFWTYWNGSTGSWQDIINKRDTWAVDGMEWGINHHFLKTGDYLSVRRNSLNADTTLTFPVGRWIHVAITADNKDVNFYINGILSSTKPYEYGIKNDAMIHVGTSPNGAVDAYNGAIDELRFYSHLLNGDEIMAIYWTDANPGKPIPTTKPRPVATATPQPTPNPTLSTIPLQKSDLLLDAFPGAEGYGKVYFRNIRSVSATIKLPYPV